MPARSLNTLALGAVAALTALAYALAGTIPPRLASGIGGVAFFLLAVAASTDIRAINWRVVGAGFALQLGLALAVLHVPAVYRVFEGAGKFIETFLTFTNVQVETLFGFKPDSFPLAFVIVPAVIFVATVFSILFHLRILQAVVWVLARGMVLLLGRRGVSGAESLSAVANVFMGQTEAPLIVAPYVGRMTRSELLAVMVGGMATVAGGVMAAYVRMGVPPVALLTTSVMAAPCGLYLAKILIPETEEPETRGTVQTAETPGYANVIDAAASGASEGMRLGINIVAMLIAFGALILFIDYLLAQVGAPSLGQLFAIVFSPVAVLLGVDGPDVPKVAELLGIKLVGNEFLAFAAMTETYGPGKPAAMSPRSLALTTFALTGFANISSIGIQLGGIGSLPRDPVEQRALRGRLARLGPRALLGGFLATLLNAAIVGTIGLPGGE